MEANQLLDLISYMYQFAGNHGAPVEVLDALDAAANGLPFSVDTLPRITGACVDAEER